MLFFELFDVLLLAAGVLGFFRLRENPESKVFWLALACGVFLSGLDLAILAIINAPAPDGRLPSVYWGGAVSTAMANLVLEVELVCFWLPFFGCYAGRRSAKLKS